MTNTKPKAVIYCRTASKQQKRGDHGVAIQEERCHAYAKSHSYEVAKVFSDSGVSGLESQRPGLQALLDYISTHSEESFVIIIDELSRIARSLIGLEKVRCKLRNLGARFECLTMSVDDSAESRFIENVLVAREELLVAKQGLVCRQQEEGTKL